MKQFKKWSKLSNSNSLEESIAEERAWEAALEWVYREGYYIIGNPAFRDSSILDVIKKELKET